MINIFITWIFVLLLHRDTLGTIYDTPEPWGLFFQDNVTPQMEGLEELHNNIMFYLAISSFAVSWIILSIILNYKKAKNSRKIVSHILVTLIDKGIYTLIIICENKVKSRFKVKNKVKSRFKVKNKVNSAGPVLTLLYAKAANGQLTLTETKFVNHVYNINRYEHFTEIKVAYVEGSNASSERLNTFYTDLIALATSNSNYNIPTWNQIMLNADGALVLSRMSNAYHNYRSTINDDYYKQFHYFTTYHDFMYNKIKLMETEIDTIVHFYFKLWANNFSLTQEQKTNIYTSYDRLLTLREQKDSAYLDFKLEYMGKLFEITTWLINPHGSIINRYINTNTYTEYLAKTGIPSNISGHQFEYLNWISDRDCKRIIDQLLHNQNNQFTNLRNVRFSTVFDTVFQVNSVNALDAQSISTIINDLTSVGLIAS